ncbi:MAG: carbamoyltransferase HypF, partial [Gammaproteobacteria bacterium]
RLARSLGLVGWVANSTQGVTIEIQGDATQLDTFFKTLPVSAPHQTPLDITDLNAIAVIDCAAHEVSTQADFVIAPSQTDAQTEHPVTMSIPHDLFPCSDCLHEFHDTSNRRYHYPFIACTACGPRWTVLRQLPFDRVNTSYADFPPCDECLQEYHDPNSRRCHHQGISCPQCGPQLTLVDQNVAEQNGTLLASPDAVLAKCAERLAAGDIVAIKSVGGFQLIVDAHNTDAIQRLRQRKQRPTKPLALMFPNLEQVLQYCHAETHEQQTLISPQRPIVLLSRKMLLPSKQNLPEAVAPQQSYIGALLPCSTVHEALFTQWRTPLIATSGNASHDPMCFTNTDALTRLAELADCFLLHNLSITQALDDSVVRLIGNRSVVLRAARGFAPYVLPISPPQRSQALPASLCAVGGHQKNTVALLNPEGIFVSPHIGDLHTVSSQQRFVDTVARCRTLLACNPSTCITDLHPDYGSSQWVAEQHVKSCAVQHHIAHFFSVMAEHYYRGPALGVCWDGSGLGTDGTLWGGEFFVWDGNTRVERIAHLRPFPLPGGDQAIREPRRQALGLLFAMQAEIPDHLRASFSDSEWQNLHVMINNQINTPLCSSVGRLIDAVAALLQCCYLNRFEADAALRLEALAEGAKNNLNTLPFTLPFTIDRTDACRVINWQALIDRLLSQHKANSDHSELAAAFHNSLAEMIMAVSNEVPDLPVFLSGGVFQNKILTEKVIARMHQQHRTVLMHRQVPPNDGGLAVGQLYYTLHAPSMSSCV